MKGDLGGTGGRGHRVSGTGLDPGNEVRFCHCVLDMSWRGVERLTRKAGKLILKAWVDRQGGLA